MVLTKTQIYTLDMVFIHQGWHPECGIVLETVEQTRRTCEELLGLELLSCSEDTGWYAITQQGAERRKEGICRLREERIQAAT
jgi:hypothetical protein